MCRYIPARRPSFTITSMPSGIAMMNTGRCSAQSATTDALDHQAGIAEVQKWLGHANISTTRIYDHRRMWP